MDGTLLVLRADLVVYVPAAAMRPEAAAAFHDAFERALGGEVRIVVLTDPVRVLDARGSKPDLIALAERLTTLMPRPEASWDEIAEALG